MSQYSQPPNPQRAFDSSEGDPGAAPEGALLRGPQGQPRHVRVAIMGSGFGGLCMAIKLKAAGVHDFVILERSHTVGGTWRDNTYPGCECDVPSHLYSYSFEPELEWSKPFAGHAEIQAYIQRCTDKYDLRQHVQFGANIERAEFDEDKNQWRIATSVGPLTADAVVTALGGLSNPLIPDLPGLDTFKGSSFHSARWDHSYDFAGKRVAVIGTGASTIQFLPEVAPQCDHLTLFQRTPAWVFPKNNRPFGRLARWVLRNVPLVRRLYRALIFWSFEMAGFAMRHPNMMQGAKRIGRRQINRSIKDRALRSLLTPDYTPGCKRILLSDDYYPALARSNVEVTGSGIREVREHSIVTADGQEHPVDVILFGTGFEVATGRMRPDLFGRDGVEFNALMEQRPEAYLGVFVAGFPNLFMLGGPNSGLGHNSIIYILEGAVRQTMMALGLMDERRAVSMEVRPEAQREYNRKVQEKLRETVWTTGCSSYYQASDGTVAAIWPGSAHSYQVATRVLNEEHVLLGEPEAS